MIKKQLLISNQKVKLDEKDINFKKLNDDFKLQKSKINHQEDTIDLLKQIENCFEIVGKWLERDVEYC